LIIKKDRFTLRDFKEEDFEDVHSYSEDIDNLKYTLWGPNSKEDTIRFINHAIKTSKESPRIIYEFAIEINENMKSKVIGGCGLYLYDDMKIGEVGWTLNKKYWRVGYGTEVAKALIELGFKEINLNLIFATCDSDNIGSYKVMEKCNMKRKYHKVKVRSSREKGIYKDEFKYYLLREEYKN